MGSEESIYRPLMYEAALVSRESPPDGVKNTERAKGLEQILLLLLDYRDLEQRPDRQRFLDQAIETVDLLLRRARHPCPFGIFELPKYRVVAHRVPADEVGVGEPSRGVAGLLGDRYRFPLSVAFDLLEPQQVHVQELELQGALLNGALGRESPEFMALRDNPEQESGDQAAHAVLSGAGGRAEDVWMVELDPQEFTLRWRDPGSSSRVELMVDLAVPPRVASARGPLLLFIQGRVKVSGAKHDGWSVANVLGLSLDDYR